MLTVLNCFSVSESLPPLLFPSTSFYGKKSVNYKEDKLTYFPGLPPKEFIFGQIEVASCKQQMAKV